MNVRAEFVNAPSVDASRAVIDGDGSVRSPAVEIDDLPGPRPLPVVGNTLQFGAHGGMHAALESWTDRYGPIFKAHLGKAVLPVVADASLIHEILRRRPEVFGRSQVLSSVINAISPVGLFTAEGEVWQRQRRLVMRALTPEQVRRSFPIIRSVTERLHGKWLAEARAGRVSDLGTDFRRFAVDVATWMSMGQDIDTLSHPDHPLQSDVDLWFSLIGRRMVSPIKWWKIVKLPIDRRGDAAMARLQALIEELIAQGRETLEREPGLRERPANVLQALIAARDEPGSGFTDDDVRGNVLTFLFAGEDTAASVMGWLVHLLATTPRALAAATDEADRLLGARPMIEAFDEVGRFDYMEAAVTESMRLKPIAPLLMATALRDVEIAGLRVPRCRTMVLALRQASRRAPAFVDQDVFEPDRWLAAASAAPGLDDPKRAMFPFGAGPRLCPGRYLAMVMITTAVSMAVRNFSIAFEPGCGRERLAFTMAPESLRARLTPR